MRVKEEAHDYRYFPDPDLLPLELTAEDIDETQGTTLPELPDEKKARFMQRLRPIGLRRARAGRGARDADFFEAVAEKEPRTPRWPQTG